MKKILVVGLGNPILGDDGVGWHVAEEVVRRLTSPVSPLSTTRGDGQKDKIEVDCLSLGGLSLMERMVGYDQVILIDAIETGQQPSGTVQVFSLDELPDPDAGHSASPHDTTLLTAMNAGRQLGVSLPEIVKVVAVEVKNVYDFSEELSAPVAASVPLAVDRVMELLGTLHSGKE